VTFIALGGELDDLNDDLLANRPQSDNVIVFGNANIQSQKYKVKIYGRKLRQLIKQFLVDFDSKFDRKGTFAVSLFPRKLNTLLEQ